MKVSENISKLNFLLQQTEGQKKLSNVTVLCFAVEARCPSDNVFNLIIMF